MNNESSNCLKDILNVILVLQQNACPENCLDTCDRPVLGGGPNCLVCNTRPVMLYTCGGNGSPWSVPTSKESIINCADATLTDNCSPVFRVEKIDCDCVTFRVLVANPDTTSIYPYVGTTSFFTMDTNCLCSIRCLNDTFVECVC